MLLLLFPEIFFLCLFFTVYFVALPPVSCIFSLIIITLQTHLSNPTTQKAYVFHSSDKNKQILREQTYKCNIPVRKKIFSTSLTRHVILCKQHNEQWLKKSPKSEKIRQSLNICHYKVHIHIQCPMTVQHIISYAYTIDTYKCHSCKHHASL